MLKGKIYIGPICAKFEIELCAVNIPAFIDFLVQGEESMPPAPTAITIPINEFGEVKPIYRDVFGNICVQSDGVTPVPVVSPVFTSSTPDTSASLLSDGNVVLAELTTATAGEVSTISVVDANGLKGSIIVTEGPSQANVPAAIDFNVIGVTPTATTI